MQGRWMWMRIGDHCAPHLGVARAIVDDKRRLARHDSGSSEGGARCRCAEEKSLQGAGARMKRMRRHGGDMSRAGRGRARARQGAVTSNGSVGGVACTMSGRHAR